MSVIRLGPSPDAPGFTRVAVQRTYDPGVGVLVFGIDVATPLLGDRSQRRRLMRAIAEVWRP